MSYKPPTESAEDIQSLPLGVRLISLFAGIILLVLGWKSLVPDYKLIQKMTHLDQYYQPTPGKMLQVAIRGDTLSHGKKCYPDVLFEYFVDGQSVWGWRFSYEDEPRRKTLWEKRLGSYHVGESVTVYVNPNDAKDSFIEKKRDSILRPVLKALLAAAFMTFGAFLFSIPTFAFVGWLFRKR